MLREVSLLMNANCWERFPRTFCLTSEAVELVGGLLGGSQSSSVSAKWLRTKACSGNQPFSFFDTQQRSRNKRVEGHFVFSFVAAFVSFLCFARSVSCHVHFVFAKFQLETIALLKMISKCVWVIPAFRAQESSFDGECVPVFKLCVETWFCDGPPLLFAPCSGLVVRLLLSV